MADYIEINSNISPQPNMMQRSAASPLDRSSMFSSYEDAVEYALGLYKKDGERRASAHDSRKLAGTSYVGQIITVYEDGVITHYTIKEDRSLDPVDKKNANISELTNDAGYITSDAINGKADITAVTSSIESAIASETARTEGAYAAINHTHDQYSPTGHNHDDRYYTESEVDTLLAGKADSGHTHDYATAQDIQDAISAETARTESTYLKNHQDISGKADVSALTEYATTAFTEATYVKSLSGYATEEYVDNAVSDKADASALTEYATTAFTEQTYLKNHQDISGKADATAVTASIEAAIQAEVERADETYLTSHQDISGKADVSALTEYATTAFTEQTYLKSHQDISGKVDISALTDYATTAFTEQTYLKGHQDISGKADASAVTADIASAIATETGRTESTYQKTLTPGAKINIVNDVISVTGLPTSNTAFTNDAGYLVATDIANKADATGVTAEIASAVTDMATQTWVGQQGFAAASAISEYTIEQLATPESGAQASYVLKKDGTQTGATINIPVAQVLDDAQIRTVTAADKAAGGKFENDSEFAEGDKYMDFDFNGNHQYLNVKTLITDYEAGDAITINGNNEISVKLATAQTQSVASGASKNFATIEESGLRVGGMDTDVTVTTSDIQVVGGPISANNVFTNNVIPAGTSVQEILTKLLCKEMNPTTTKPSVGVSITQGGKHEVGTQVSPSYTISFNSGSYTYGPATNVSATGYEVSDTFGNTADTTTGSLTAFTVGDSTDYKVSAKANYSAGSVPVTNLGNAYPSGQIQASSTTLVNSNNITGYRCYFYGSTTAVTPGNSWTSADVRALSGKSTKAVTSGEFSMSIPDNTKQVIVAFPSSSNLSLTKVLDGNASWSNITGNFELFTVNVEGANGYTAVEYKVYIWTPSATLQANTYKITLG